ncbi:hypothetical protein CIHG_00970 [Coccidioides immitis H538.4]|uniref:Uncharacterized protein n=1 Tax=Coccidioides immitis H538.4 TaxID=396776 RepID=A0A0J8U835_COCIT|nr:hypothetical protein CIHG_00970 [Coccidioides immitis H538.4]
MVHPEPDRIQTGIANDAPVNRLLLPSTSLLDTQFTRAPLGFRGGPDEFPADVDKEFTKSE